MGSMFKGASSFTSDLSKWQVGKVTNMNAMFEYADKFDSDLSQWQVGKVTSMAYIFPVPHIYGQQIQRQSIRLASRKGLAHGGHVWRCQKL